MSATPITAGTKYAEIKVGQSLNGRLGTLRLLDEPDYAGEHGVASDTSRREDQPSPSVNRRAVNVIPGVLRHRGAFAGEHRLIHRGRAGLDNAVHRDSLPRPDNDPITDDYVVDRHVDMLVVPDDPRGLGLESHESLDCIRGTAVSPSPP